MADGSRHVTRLHEGRARHDHPAAREVQVAAQVACLEGVAARELPAPHAVPEGVQDRRVDLHVRRAAHLIPSRGVPDGGLRAPEGRAGLHVQRPVRAGGAHHGVREAVAAVVEIHPHVPQVEVLGQHPPRRAGLPAEDLPRVEVDLGAVELAGEAQRPPREVHTPHPQAHVVRLGVHARALQERAAQVGAPDGPADAVRADGVPARQVAQEGPRQDRPREDHEERQNDQHGDEGDEHDERPAGTGHEGIVWTAT